MERLISRKRLIGLLLTGCACVGIVTSGTFLSGGRNVTVYDCEGNKVAELYLENNELQYQCETGYEAYFDLVRNEVINIVMEQEGTDRSSAMQKIVSDGFEIRTGFSQDAMDGMIDVYSRTPEVTNGNSAAALSNTEGCISACYSISADGQNYNYVNIPAYAGSTIKPLSVYTPALEEGLITWSSMYRDSPYAMVENSSGQMVEWPVNTEPYTDQMITVEKAVAESNNAVAVKVLKDCGAEKACLFLENAFDISVQQEQEIIREKGEDRALANVALGYLDAGVTVEQMTAAYQIFANGGMYYTPHTVTQIVNNEGEYYAPDGKGVRVVSEETAFIMNRLLREVVLGGTGTLAQTEDAEVCGKTGTSEYGDHWFVGFTPEYVCTVWYESDSEIGTTDSSVQAVHDILASLELSEDAVYPRMKNVYEMEYCMETGLLRGAGCQKISRGYYAGNNMPGICSECE